MPPKTPIILVPDPPGSYSLIVRVFRRLSGFPEYMQSPALESVQAIKTTTESTAKPHCDPYPGSDFDPDISVRCASSIVKRIRHAVISSAVLDSDDESDVRRGTSG